MLISELLEVVLMPGNENSGAGIPFRMPEKELNAAIKKYKQDATDGKFPRPSWPHFCATLGYTEAEVKECIERGGKAKCILWQSSCVKKGCNLGSRGDAQR